MEVTSKVEGEEMDCQNQNLNQAMVQDIGMVVDQKLAIEVVGLLMLEKVEQEEEVRWGVVESGADLVEEVVAKGSAVLHQIVQAGLQFAASGVFVKLLINLMEIQMLGNAHLPMIAHNGLLPALSLVTVK